MEKYTTVDTFFKYIDGFVNLGTSDIYERIKYVSKFEKENGELPNEIKMFRFGYDYYRYPCPSDENFYKCGEFIKNENCENLRDIFRKYINDLFNNKVTPMSIGKFLNHINVTFTSRKNKYNNTDLHCGRSSERIASWFLKNKYAGNITNVKIQIPPKYNYLKNESYTVQDMCFALGYIFLPENNSKHFRFTNPHTANPQYLNFEDISGFRNEKTLLTKLIDTCCFKAKDLIKLAKSGSLSLTYILDNCIGCFTERDITSLINIFGDDLFTTKNKESAKAFQIFKHYNCSKKQVERILSKIDLSLHFDSIEKFLNQMHTNKLHLSTSRESILKVISKKYPELEVLYNLQ